MAKEQGSPGASSARGGDPGLLILTSLASGPKHGYGLLLDIEAFAGLRLGPGTLYGAITRLEERGLIESLPVEGRIRPYRITRAGLAALEAALSELQRIVKEGTRRLRLRGRATGAVAASALR